MPKTPRLNRIIRKRDIPEYTGLQRTSIDALIKRGELKVFTITEHGRAKGIFEDDLVRWQQRRRGASDAAGQ
jgi:hypothetical protein